MSTPVDAARDEYAEEMNLELRRSIAARVLEAMDVDQYLIDAVRDARPDGVAADLAADEVAHEEFFDLTKEGEQVRAWFAFTEEDLLSLARDRVPEWLKYDADAALDGAQ